MCGIFGILSAKPYKVTQAFADKISSLMHLRGPNATGFYGYHRETQKTFLQSQVPYEEAWDVFFMHKRLSILDLDTHSNQPMQSCDGRYVIIFNGEIYNYKTLRQILEQQGVTFQTDCDTEVLLQYLIHSGIENLQELEGMFSFAFFDRVENKCILARDPYGIKPLYVFKTTDFFAFSSRIDCLLELPECSRKPNIKQCINYLVLGNIGYDPTTVLEDIVRCKPGHVITLQIRDNHLSCEMHEYFRWETSKIEKCSDFNTCAQTVRRLLEESVEKHLASDVPVCCNLSGGIDSSGITAIASRYHSNLTAFTYQADDPKIDESGYAECVAKHCGIRLMKVKIQPTDLEKDFDRYILQQEELFGSASNYASYKVFEDQKKRGFTVSLNGQGGDEVFTGYASYLPSAIGEAFISRSWRQVWGLFRNSADKIQLIGFLVDGMLERLPMFRATLRRLYQRGSYCGFEPRILKEHLLLYPSKPCSLRKAIDEKLKITSIPHLLRSDDKNAMAFSIENRVPFLWDPLVQFAHTLPEEYLISNDGWQKFILRKAIEDWVPKEIAWRKDKIGYAPTESRWLLANASFVTHILSSKVLDKLPGVRSGVVRAHWKKIADRNRTDGWRSDIIWRYISLIRWMELFRISV